MSEKQSILKTCSVCGQQKPLAAFLQMSGTLGGIYGNICATCRSIEPAHPEAKGEESSRSGSGFKIDAKSKLQIKKDQEKKWLEIEERYHEERDEEKEDQLVHLEKTQVKAKTEQDHRNFIQKTSFLNKKNTKKQQTTTPGGVSETTKREQEIDFRAPFMDTFGKEKFKGTAFKHFSTRENKNLVGPTTPPNGDEKELSKKIEKTWPSKGKR